MKTVARKAFSIIVEREQIASLWQIPENVQSINEEVKKLYEVLDVNYFLTPLHAGNDRHLTITLQFNETGKCALSCKEGYIGIMDEDDATLFADTPENAMEKFYTALKRGCKILITGKSKQFISADYRFYLSLFEKGYLIVTLEGLTSGRDD